VGQRQGRHRRQRRGPPARRHRRAGQLGSNLHRTTALTEKGDPIGVGETPNEHDIITGSKPDGRAYTDAADHTCKNYTSSGEGSVQLGHRPHQPRRHRRQRVVELHPRQPRLQPGT
jgi:hypothetical protein